MGTMSLFYQPVLCLCTKIDLSVYGHDASYKTVKLGFRFVLLGCVVCGNFRIVLLFCRHGEHPFCLCRRQGHDTSAESQGVQPRVMNSALCQRDDCNNNNSGDLLARTTAVSK